MTKNTYTIGEISERFGIHRDTLRNWERDGVLVPERIGLRGDRVYTDEHIAIINDKKLAKSVSLYKRAAKSKPATTEDMTLTQLKTFLWRSADILRGSVDSSVYKKYIFGLLFYKRMSDVWQEEYDQAMAEYHDEDIAKADYNHRFQVPKDASWSVVEDTAKNIGLKLNEVIDKITAANSPRLDRIFDDLDFANADRFPDEVLQRLINHFSEHKFGENYFSSDVLGDAYEYLIQQFAADAGKKGGEFYTPREVERLVMHILKPHEKDHIYDPTAGSAGFLLEAYQYVRQNGDENKARSLYLYGQEKELDTFAIGKINMFLHGLESADIRRGDTLADPQFLTESGSLKTFDIVVANFPYSIKEWPYNRFAKDKFGRCDGYETPPTKNADYAFILHIIKSLNMNGKAGVVVPHGVLFRSGAEGRIREQIIKNDLIEAVIAMPAKLFFGTSIPAAVLILNRNKPADRRGKMIIIDAEAEYEAGKKQNRLRKVDIDKITTTVDTFRTVEKYATVVTTEQLAENDFNLNVKRYVDTSVEQETVDINDIIAELKDLELQRADADAAVYEALKGLGYKV
jgi:type I restriction enzyme M protein